MGTGQSCTNRRSCIRTRPHAGPTLELVEQWTVELQVLRRRSPSADAVETLSICVRELVEAIKAACDARLHLTIADVHATSRIPISTLR